MLGVEGVYGQGPPSVASGPRTYTHPGRRHVHSVPSVPGV